MHTLSAPVREFLAAHHDAVLTTFRRDGSAQMSIVTCGLYREGVAFMTAPDLAKVANLRRDPRCSILVSQHNWWGYVVLQGNARVYAPDNTDPEELRLILRDVYRSAAAKVHPDWEEFDQAMVAEGRPAVVVSPESEFMQILRPADA